MTATIKTGRPAADGRRRGPGPGPGKPRADTDQRAAGDVADAAAERLRRRTDRHAVRVAQPHPPDDLERNARDDDRGRDDPVHVERLEAEHLLDAEPRDDLGLVEHAAEDAADEEIRNEIHKSGSRMNVAARPPAKNPQTATSDAS